MNVDVEQAVGTVTRSVRRSEKEGRPAVAVVLSRSYDTDVDDLWDAVTNPERLPRWFSPVSGELRPGGRYQVEGNAGGTITACEPPATGTAHFAATWEFGGGVSWIDVRVQQEGPTARLTLEHLAFEEGEHWEQFGPGAVGVGWDLSLVGLAQHVAAGAAAAGFDFAEGMAWMSSENGKAFMRGSGEAWGASHMAAGEDPAAAGRMAAATIAFYTGEGAAATDGG